MMDDLQNMIAIISSSYSIFYLPASYLILLYFQISNFFFYSAEARRAQGRRLSIPSFGLLTNP
jgi:hypothetical protein